MSQSVALKFEFSPDMHEQQAMRTLRYDLAMNAFGNGRVFELLPIQKLVGSASGSLLDMMSGNGFISRFLGDGFDMVHALDRNLPSSSPFSHRYRRFRYDAAHPRIARVMPTQYDCIVSLAAFHHLIPGEGVHNFTFEQVQDYRTQCLVRWRDLLAEGGRLVIGDVPAYNQPAIDLPRSLAGSKFAAIQNIVSDLPKISECDLYDADPEPAAFFDEFVAAESITPHDAVFESADILALLMEGAGYSDIKSAVYFTPWYFRSEREAAWFFLNLFGIGEETVETPSELPANIMNHVLSAIDRFLGCGYTGFGEFWVGWKLLYVSGEKVG